MSTVQIEKFKSWLSIAGLEEKPHQTKGLKWCLEQEEKTNEHRGGFLCDEMGLGKTILMLGCIYTNFHDHTLIVVPPALLSQWNGIINKFFKHKPLIFHGPNVKHIKIDRLESSPIVLTTYGMLSCSKKSTTKRIKCQSVHWNRVIYDEAQHLRTVKTNKFAGAAKLNSEIRNGLSILF